MEFLLLALPLYLNDSIHVYIHPSVNTCNRSSVYEILIASFALVKYQ